MKNRQTTSFKAQFTLVTSLIMISILLVVTSTLSAQGWERILPLDSERDVAAKRLVATPDGGFMSIGSVNDNLFYRILTLAKLDTDGVLQWRKFYHSATHGFDLTPTNDGSYMLVGRAVNDIYVGKVDQQGNLEWEQTLPAPPHLNDAKIKQTLDGGSVLSFETGDFYLMKIDSLGVKEWEFLNPTTLTYDNNYDVIVNANNTYSLIGQTTISSSTYGAPLVIVLDSTGNSISQQQFTTGEGFTCATKTQDGGAVYAGYDGSNMLMVKFDSNDTLVWTKVIQLNGFQAIKAIAESPNGDLVATGIDVGNSPVRGSFVLKTDPQGNLIWKVVFDKPAQEVDLTGITVSSDGNGFIGVSGTITTLQGASFVGEYYLKLDQNGNLHQSFTVGNVAHDSNLNCTVDSSELNLQNWMVEAKGAQTHYAITDQTGNYNINLDSGNYILSVIPPNNLWLPCQPQSIYVPPKDTLYTDLAVQSGENCVNLIVDISTPLLRRCFDNIYTVNYCNQGTIPSPNSYLEIEFDPFMTVNSSTLPWTAQTGNLYTFWIGNVNVNECGSFSVNVAVDCDSTVLGQTHCVEAHIFPDSICVPFGTGWDGSITSLDVTCAPDSITFIIQNTGQGGMSMQQDYVIIEDNIIMKNGFFVLAPGESLPLKVPSNGSTYRMNAGQALGYFPSSYTPTIAIEGCGVNPINQQFSTGFITDYAEDDVLDYISIDCQENIGAFDPNDKRAEPAGFGLEHFIEANVDLEYHIRFQNTGTDTAFTVAIRDTLSEFLDVSSVIPGASSHAYDFQIINGNVLKFVFNDILLVDSTTNEPGSHGFVKFRISQEDNLPLGTLIYNSAAIYFDFNEPVITNQTFHEIGEDFIPIQITTKAVDLPDHPDYSINVRPNPFVKYADFELKNAPVGQKTFKLYNASGTLLKQAQFVDDKYYRFNRDLLVSGIYFYTIHLDQKTLGSGKVIIQ